MRDKIIYSNLVLRLHPLFQQCKDIETKICIISAKWPSNNTKKKKKRIIIRIYQGYIPRTLWKTVSQARRGNKLPVALSQSGQKHKTMRRLSDNHLLCFFLPPHSSWRGVSLTRGWNERGSGYGSLTPAPTRVPQVALTRGLGPHFLPRSAAPKYSAPNRSINRWAGGSRTFFTAFPPRPWGKSFPEKNCLGQFNPFYSQTP